MSSLPDTEYMNSWELYKRVDSQLEVRDGSTALSQPVPILEDGPVKAGFFLWETTVVQGRPKPPVRPHTRVLASAIDGSVLRQSQYTPRPVPPFFGRIPNVQRLEGRPFSRIIESVERTSPEVWRSYELARRAMQTTEDAAALQAAKHLLEFRTTVSEASFPFYVAEAPDFFAWLLEMHDRRDPSDPGHAP